MTRILSTGEMSFDDLDPELQHKPASWGSGRILRTLGGALLVASFSTFLLRRWELNSDLFRYAVMLLHTVLLVASALFCSFGIRENRGARTLLALTLAAVPFNVAVLAGLVYSRHVWDDANVVRPATFLWVAPSESALLVTLGVALPVLGACAWFALRTLVRTKAQRMLLVFAGTNALLLVPLRTPLFSASAAIVAVSILAGLDLWQFGESSVLGTPEGRMVRGLMVAPVALLLGRSAFLYPDVSLLVGATSMSLGVWCAVLVRRQSSSKERQGWVVLAAMSLVIGWLCIWTDVECLPGFAERWCLLALVLPWAVVLQVLAQLSEASRVHLRTLGTLAILSATLPSLFCYPSTLMELTCITVGISWLLLGVWLRSKLCVVGGGVVVLAGLVYQLLDRVHIEVLSSWLFLSGSGLCLILLASWLERHQAQLRHRLATALTLARKWDY